MISTKGAPNSEAYSAQTSLRALRIQRLIRPKRVITKGAPNLEASLCWPKRVIHEGRSEFGDLFGPNVSFTKGTPNSEAFLCWPIAIATKGARNSKAYLPKRVIHEGRSKFGGFFVLANCDFHEGHFEFRVF